MGLRNKALTGSAIAAMAIATPFIGGLEGMKSIPYKDIGGVWTVCYGETHNINFSHEYTKDECDKMLAARVPDYYNSAMIYIKDVEDVPITMRAAITSFNYNVGSGNFYRSTLLRKVNKKDYWGACKELDKWVYAANMYVRGLANSRAAEKRLCIAELKGGNGA